MDEKKVKLATKGIVWGIVNRIANLVFPFFVRTAMIYTIGSEYLGLNSVFTSLLQILSFAELGFGQVMVYSMYRHIANENKDGICALLNLYKKIYRTIGFIILGIGLAIMPFIRFFIKGNYPDDVNLYVLYGIYLFNNVVSYMLFTYKESLLSAHQLYYVSSNIQTVCHTLMYIGEAVALLFLRNYYVYVIMIPLCTILNNLLIAYEAKKRFPGYIEKGEVDKSESKEIRKNVLAGIGHKLGPTATTSVDNLVVSSFLGLILASVYNNYNYIVVMVSTMVALVFNSFTAGVGVSIAKRSRKENYNDFKFFTFFNNLLTGWTSIFLVCLLQNTMWLWVGKRNGEEFMYSTLTVVLLVLMYYVQQIRIIVFMYKSAAGMWYSDRYKPYVAAGANALLDIILVNFLGLPGIILSTIFARAMIGLPWETHALFKEYFKISKKEYYVSLLKYFCINLLVGGATYFVCCFVGEDTIVSLLIRTGICVVVPLVLYVLLYFRNDYMKKIYKRTLVKFRKSRKKKAEKAQS